MKKCLDCNKPFNPEGWNDKRCANCKAKRDNKENWWEDEKE